MSPQSLRAGDGCVCVCTHMQVNTTETGWPQRWAHGTWQRCRGRTRRFHTRLMPQRPRRTHTFRVYVLLDTRHRRSVTPPPGAVYTPKGRMVSGGSAKSNLKKKKRRQRRTTANSTYAPLFTLTASLCPRPSSLFGSVDHVPLPEFLVRVPSPLPLMNAPYVAVQEGPTPSTRDTK